MGRLSRRHLILSILLMAVIVFFVVSLRGGHPAPGRGPAVAAKQAAQAAKAKPVAKLPPAAPGDADFRRYAALASAGIFSETRNAPPPPVKILSLPPPPPFPPAPPPPRPPDLSGWSYAGSVTLSGDKLGVMKLGIIQNEATASVNYLSVGDSFMGAKVEAVDRESIRFSNGAASATLSRARDYPVAPLSQGANAAAPNPGGR